MQSKMAGPGIVLGLAFGTATVSVTSAAVPAGYVTLDVEAPRNAVPSHPDRGRATDKTSAAQGAERVHLRALLDDMRTSADVHTKACGLTAVELTAHWFNASAASDIANAPSPGLLTALVAAIPDNLR
ncbi:MAG: hypothetical protein ABI843_14355 [Dokdonella sp.]